MALKCCERLAGALGLEVDGQWLAVTGQWLAVKVFFVVRDSFLKGVPAGSGMFRCSWFYRTCHPWSLAKHISIISQLYTSHNLSAQWLLRGKPNWFIDVAAIEGILVHCKLLLYQHSVRLPQ